MSQELRVIEALAKMVETSKANMELEEKAPTKPCPHKHTETIDFSHFTGKVYIRCKDCGMVLKGA